MATFDVRSDSLAFARLAEDAANKPFERADGREHSLAQGEPESEGLPMAMT
jgi:hypothetical protein